VLVSQIELLREPTEVTGPIEVDTDTRLLRSLEGSHGPRPRGAAVTAAFPARAPEHEEFRPCATCCRCPATRLTACGS
jgi:hypothetical protein